MILISLLFLCGLLPWTATSMRKDLLAQLRQETVDMFYHGYDNYMKHAFPEDEVRSDIKLTIYMRSLNKLLIHASL